MQYGGLVLVFLAFGCAEQGDVTSQAKPAVVHGMDCVTVGTPYGGTLDRCENDEAICYVGDSVESFAVSCHWKGSR